MARYTDIAMASSDLGLAAASHEHPETSTTYLSVDFNATSSTTISPSQTPRFAVLDHLTRSSVFPKDIEGTQASPVDLTANNQENLPPYSDLTVRFPFDNLNLNSQRQSLNDLDPNNANDHTAAALRVKPVEVINLDPTTQEDFEKVLQQKDNKIAEMSRRLREQDRIIADRGADHMQAMWHKNRIIALRKTRIRDLEIREHKLEKDMRWSRDNGFDLLQENKWLKRKLLEAYQKLDDDAREQAEARWRSDSSKQDDQDANSGEAVKPENENVNEGDYEML
ncbi:MAG: hypothetical protein Q9160_004718 [Pyrenula sp. 1 TL-2023]